MKSENPCPSVELYNADCMEVMAQYQDNHFDLAIVDPPYGIGVDGQKESICKNPKHNRKSHDFKGWDNKIPDFDYFAQLERISINQIIFGANYFVKHLQKGTKGWIIWDKGQYGLTMSDCEIAYSSFDKPTRAFKFNRGLIAQNGGSIHPTQKPVALYEWLFKNYAKEGDKILDTHLGSGSIVIALDKMNKIEKMDLSLVGCELDKDYFDAACERIKEQTSQMTIFE